MTEMQVVLKLKSAQTLEQRIREFLSKKCLPPGKVMPKIEGKELIARNYTNHLRSLKTAVITKRIYKSKDSFTKLLTRRTLPLANVRSMFLTKPQKAPTDTFSGLSEPAPKSPSSPTRKKQPLLREDELYPLWITESPQFGQISRSSLDENSNQIVPFPFVQPLPHEEENIKNRAFKTLDNTVHKGSAGYSTAEELVKKHLKNYDNEMEQFDVYNARFNTLLK
jgi:hypothetical protein